MSFLFKLYLRKVYYNAKKSQIEFKFVSLQLNIQKR